MRFRLERVRHLPCGLPPLSRHALERARDDGIDRGRQIGAQHAHGRRVGRENLRDDRLLRRRGEWRLACEHLVAHGAEREDVAARIECALAGRLLGTHVLRSADRKPRLRERAGRCAATRRARIQRARDAEVREERIAPRGQQNVLGLDVAVDHTLLVGVVERTCDLADDPRYILHRHLPLVAEPVAQRLPLHVRHREPELAVGRLSGVVYAQDVRMLQLRRCRDLAAKALGAQRCGEVGIEHLERNAPLMLRIPCEVDGGHPAAAKLALDRVGVAECGLEPIEV